MKPAEEVAREAWEIGSSIFTVPRLTEIITAARKEGAKDMRERAAEIVESSEMTDLGIRSLSLPGEDK